MTPDAAERRARARVAARGHDIVTTGHVIEWPASGCARMTERETRTHIPGEPDEADRDVLSLADALRAAEARAVAAERAIGLLSRTLGCESDDPAGVVREALDHIADLDVRATAAEEQRLAADARHAALAGAVRAEREARDAREAALRSERVARVADASADMAGWQVAHDRYTSARVAHERASTHLTALLRGAPGGYVPARVVREYLDAAAASENDRGDVDRITDAIERGLSMNYPGLTDANRRAGVSGESLHLARTALDAALAAATTTPEEGYGR